METSAHDIICFKNAAHPAKACVSHDRPSNRTVRSHHQIKWTECLQLQHTWVQSLTRQKDICSIACFTQQLSEIKTSIVFFFFWSHLWLCCFHTVPGVKDHVERECLRRKLLSHLNDWQVKFPISPAGTRNLLVGDRFRGSGASGDFKRIPSVHPVRRGPVFMLFEGTDARLEVMSAFPEPPSLGGFRIWKRVRWSFQLLAPGQTPSV